MRFDRKEHDVGFGPVEYGVVAFPGNRFKGEIAPALRDLVESGTIRILDLAFVLKDREGRVVAGEVEDAGSEVFQAFETVNYKRDGLINDNDMTEIGATLDPESSALVIVWEDVWARKLSNAVKDAGGIVVTLQRIPREIVQAAVDYADEPVAVGA